MLRPLLISIWFIVITLSAISAYRGDHLYSDVGQPIAKLRAQKGLVQYRLADALLWDYVANGQEFSEGSVVATGKRANTQIAFKDGRSIDLGENSQIVLTLDAENKQDDSYVVTLLKGSLAVNTVRIPLEKKAAVKPFKIRSDGHEVVLAAKNDMVSLEKAVGSPPSIVLREGNALIINQKSGETLQLQEKSKPFELNLNLAAGLASLPIKVTEEAAETAQPSAPEIPKPVKEKPAKPRLNLTAKPLVPPPPPPSGRIYLMGKGSGAEIQRTLNAAAVIKLNELPAGYLTIYLDRWQQAAAKDWIFQREILPQSEAKIVIHLDRSELPRFSGVLAASGRFKIESGSRQALESASAFVIRNERVIAGFAVSSGDLALDPNGWLSLTRGDFLYKGNAQAYIPTQQITEMLTSGEGSLYALTGGRMQRVSKQLLRTYPDAGQSALKASAAVFREPVTIMASRGGL